MKASKQFQFYALLLAVSASMLNANIACAQENFRISRPSATSNSQPQQPVAAAPLKANATVNTDQTSSAQYQNPIYDWERKNLQVTYEEPNPTLSAAAAVMAPPIQHHHGLKAHLGMAVVGLGAIAGTAAGTYLGASPVHHSHASYMAPPPVAAPSEPTIEVTAGHCPAAFDPEFQVPVRWWDVLSKEEASPELGPHWNLWMDAVTKVFQSHANELRSTPGVASLHIMVNPDGTIFNITPYTGAERGHPGDPISRASMSNLHHIISEVGNFPPFPQGSKVRCYHLIFSGSANL